MASAADTPRGIQARVDRSGRLLYADPELARVQAEAGGSDGGVLALPQLAAIARLAFRLAVPIERPAMLATANSDVHCWVRAVPEGDEVALSLDNWNAAPARGPRFATLAVDLAPGPASRADELSWASDKDLRLTEVSPALADLINMTCDELVGMPLTKLFRLVENEDGEMPIINALAARSDFAGQRAQSRVSSEMELSISGAAEIGPDGAFCGFRGRAQVDGEMPASANRVTQAPGHQRLDSSFDAVLRIPIERIIGEAEQISGRTDGPLRGDYAGYGADIAAAARHLLSVLSAMGDDPEFGRGMIDLAALAGEAVVLVEPIAENRRVAIALETAPPTQASGEEHAVIQILVNLLVNAIRHSPPDSVVRLSFTDRERWASVTVSDQGVGIAPQDHKRIFERFERADEQPGGTGLGLAIARRLARSMGGDVTLESAPGEGAHFTLSLPRS